MYKNNLLYVLALVIAVAFVLSMGTGLVFLLAGSGGSQGGSNPAFQSVIFNLSRGTWSDLHTWFSLVMAAGAIIHLALHWNWVVRMTKRIFSFSKPLRSGRVKLFYALDTVIVLSFILTMLTGLMFLFMGSGGYQGGRNPGFETAFLGLSRGTWSDLHTWFSLVMTAAIVTHVALHIGWLVSKTKGFFRSQPSGRLATQPVRK
jgi:hypothetical protein